MSPVTKKMLLLTSTALARLAFAGTALVFPSQGCDETGYYQTINTNSETCTETYLTDSDFQQSGNSSGLYQAYFTLETQEGQGCALIIGSNSIDAQAPPCGECTILLHTSGQCTAAQLPTPFYAWECCGEACQTQCGQIPAKRTIGDATEVLEGNEEEAVVRSPDIANLKNRPLMDSSVKAKRSDCSFTASGGLYSQAGTPTKVSNTFNTCTSSAGCTESYSGTVESSFSQSFMVSESTEAGLFDIVSETVMFGYSATWESSQSVTVSSTYTFEEGQGGYLTFAPLSQCTTGTFSGADCASMGIPTGGNPGSACVPEKDASGRLDGDVNAVTSE